MEERFTHVVTVAVRYHITATSNTAVEAVRKAIALSGDMAGDLLSSHFSTCDNQITVVSEPRIVNHRIIKNW